MAKRKSVRSNAAAAAADALCLPVAVIDERGAAARELVFQAQAIAALTCDAISGLSPESVQGRETVSRAICALDVVHTVLEKAASALEDRVLTAPVPEVSHG